MTEQAFWDFSLDFYDRPGVADACLQLQDEYGADVNLMLFALWCGTRGSQLDATALARADAAVAPWREAVVRGIRRVRRALKPPPADPFDPAAAEALRQRLLAVELEAERLQQAALARLAPPPGRAAAAPGANLACLADYAQIPPDAPPWRALLGALG